MRYKYLFAFFLIFIGCRDKELTKSLKSIYKYQDTTINLVIKSKSKINKQVTLIGEIPFTKYVDTGAYLNKNYRLFEKGDTILKEAGSFYMKVIKPDKLYIINFDYYGKSHLDSILFLR